MNLEGPLVVFIVCGLPIVLGVSVAIYGQRLRHKQLTLMMDERRLLIENGVTNLPRLELPAQSSRRVGLFDLRLCAPGPATRFGGLGSCLTRRR